MPTRQPSITSAETTALTTKHDLLNVGKRAAGADGAGADALPGDERRDGAVDLPGDDARLELDAETVDWTDFWRDVLLPPGLRGDGDCDERIAAATPVR